MKKRNGPTDAELDAMLAGARLPSWPEGRTPDINPRVEAFLKEQRMSSTNKPGLKRSTIALIGAGVLGGSGLAAAVTHQIMSRRATMVLEDGSAYEVELLESPNGASGTFVGEDGTVYGIELIEAGEGERRVSVEADSPEGGTTSVIIQDEGAARPRMMRAAGPDAKGSAGVFVDEAGNRVEVDGSAIEGWVSDEASEE